MKHHIITGLTLLVSSLSISQAQVVLTSFGSSSAPVFTIDGTFTTFSSATVNASDTDFDGNAAQTLSGEFPNVDISASFSSGLELFGSVSVNPGSAFFVRLFDSGFDSADFIGGNWGDLPSSGTGSSKLILDSVQPGFDPTDVQYVDVVGNGLSSDLLTGTVTGLSTVPEPQTFAMIAGILGLGLALIRRRR